MSNGDDPDYDRIAPWKNLWKNLLNFGKWIFWICVGLGFLVAAGIIYLAIRLAK